MSALRVIRLNSRSEEVVRWQLFLRGQSPTSEVIATGNFDKQTDVETRLFQKSHGLKADGIVGNQTYGAALMLGFSLADDLDSESDINYPRQPAWIKQITNAERYTTFGTFKYVPAPSSGDPEAIRITDDWAKKNIATFEIPQLKGVIAAPSSRKILLHVKFGPAVVKTFAEWEAAGLSGKVLTWGGAWVPRFVRGSRVTLSNHAWGTAFDINAPWNGLGKVPAHRDQKGSVRDLLLIAAENGLFSGCWFKGRPDGMHFEAGVLLNR